MDEICSNMNNVFHEAIQHFCNDYAISLPSDGKDHSMDIQNALRIIQILGNSMDERNLNNIIEPLKGDYKALKTVLDVMRAKNDSLAAGLAGMENRYNPTVTRIIDDYSGVNTYISDFRDTMDNIEAIRNSQAGYRYELEKLSNSPFYVVRDIIPYAHLACADWMTEAGMAYDHVQGEITGLYSSGS